MKLIPLLRGFALSLAGLYAFNQTTLAQGNFTFNLASDGLTSAGVFNSQGRLIRTLWAMEYLKAGSNLNASWDGLDDFGNTVASGSYTFKVIRNGATYTNIGVLGNSGTPSTSTGHIPFYTEGVTVDSSNNFYTVHGWNEPGHDVKKWSGTDGTAIMNSGHCVSECLLDAIAVEPNGTYAYVTGTGGSHDDRTQTRARIFRINLDPYLVWDQRVTNWTQEGRSINVYNGTTGYPSAGYPSTGADYPAGATTADKTIMRSPLRGIALLGNSIYVTDAIVGRVLKYDKVSGNHQQTINGIPVAATIAITPDGNTIWVGHSHTKISAYNASGSLLATPVTNLTEVRSISLVGNTMIVADTPGVIRKYTVNGTSLTLASSFGQIQRAGDWTADRMYEIHGAAQDSNGNIIVLDRVGKGGRIQKLNSSYTQLWDQLSLEFSSSMTFVKENPNTFISSTRSVYDAVRSDGSWYYLGRGHPENDHQYFGEYESTHFGIPQALRLGGNDFFYFPAGDSIAVYRIMSAVSPCGPTLKLASVLGGSKPGPDGVHREDTSIQANKYLWSWNDTQGDGVINYTPRTDPGMAGEVNLVGIGNYPDPYWQWVRNAFEVDDLGWIWFASNNRDHIPAASYPFEGKAIYTIPLQGLNSQGNPIYSWSDAVKVMDETTGVNAMGGASCEYKMVGRSHDGLVYALAHSNKSGLPQDGAVWMAGNVLLAFQETTPTFPAMMGAPKWYVPLPRAAVGMVPIRGGNGGVFTGMDVDRAIIGHYNKDGLLIGSMKSAPQYGIGYGEPGYKLSDGNLPSGRFDAYMAINCQRNPADGKIDVFGEDNWNQRVIWYRVDDSNITTASNGSVSSSAASGSRYQLTINGGAGDGKYTSGSVVSITAAAPPAGKVFVSWTGDTSGVANVNASTTTVTLSSSTKVLTAYYYWDTSASQPDKVRFVPRNAGSMIETVNDGPGSVFEGTNGDPVTGPYTIFFNPDTAHTPVENQWNEVRVNMAGYRYIRWRQVRGNGTIFDLEFYRNNVKINGPYIHSDGSLGDNPAITWDKAVDGNLSTYFDGPDVNLPGHVDAYVGVDSTGSPGAAGIPTGLSATAGNAQITLSWTGSANAASYKVKRATTSGGPYTTVATPTATTYTNTGLTNGTVYYYVVSAVNSASAESGNSSQASATPTAGTTIPSAPTGLTASSGNAQVALTWNTSSGATGYKVKRATVSGGPYAEIAIPTGTSYTDTGLTNGTVYYYVVSAYNGGGESANSSQASATPTVITVTGTYEAESGSLANGASVSGDGNASGGQYVGGMHTSNSSITWNNVNGGGSSATLTIRYASSDGTPVKGLFVNGSKVATLNFINTGGWGGSSFSTVSASVTLNSGVNTVAIVNDTNTGGVNVDKMDVAATGTPPSAPTGLAATAGNAQVALSWNAVSGATSYNLKRSTTNGGPYSTTVASPTATSYTNTGLTNGTTYYYVVTAVGAGGESGNSSQVTAAPSAGSPPVAPTGLVATAGNAQVALTWTASTGATGYKVKRATVSGGPYTQVATPTTNSYTNTSLTNGTTYFYVVSATNANGESANSNQDSATPAASGTTVTYQAESATLSNGAVVSGTNVGGMHNSNATISWSSVSGGNGGVATLVIRYASGDTAPVKGLFVNGTKVGTLGFANTGGWSTFTTLTVTATLNSGSNTVAIQNDTGTGGVDIDKMDVTANGNPPPAPTGLTGTAGSTQASLSWSASSGATSYNVKRATTNGGPYTTVSSPTATTYTNTGLTNGTTYFYVVTAVNSGGESGNSSQVSVTPASQTTASYEAEIGTLTNGAVVSGDSAASGGQMVGGMHQTDATVTWSNVNGAGTSATLTIRYATPNNNLTAGIYVNGGRVATVAFPNSGGWGGTAFSTATVSVTLNSGANTVAIRNDTGGQGINIDKMEVSGGGAALPSAPQGVSATAGNAQVALTWNSVTGATSYNVKRSTTSGGSYTTVSSPTTTSYTNTGLTNGTTYYYVVTAVGSTGESPVSTQVSATPTAPAAYEAEAGSLANGAVTSGDGSASGGQYVGGMHSSNASITWSNVNRGSAGNATLTIRYASGDTAPVKGLFVNGSKVATINFANSGGWSTWTTINVTATLNSGNNTIAIMNDTSTGGTNIDKMDVQ